MACVFAAEMLQAKHKSSGAKCEPRREKASRVFLAGLLTSRRHNGARGWSPSACRRTCRDSSGRCSIASCRKRGVVAWSARKCDGWISCARGWLSRLGWCSLNHVPRQDPIFRFPRKCDPVPLGALVWVGHAINPTGGRKSRRYSVFRAAVGTHLLSLAAINPSQGHSPPPNPEPSAVAFLRSGGSPSDRAVHIFGHYFPGSCWASPMR